MNEPELFDIGAEKAVMGSMLIDPDAIDANAVQALDAADFYVERHRWLFEAMRQLHARDDAHFDPIALGDQVGAAKLKEAGGMEYVMHLLNDTPSALHVEKYATIVKKWAQKRAYSTALKNAVKHFYEHATDDDPFTRTAEILQQAIPQNPGRERRQTSWTSDELLTANFPEPTWVVPGILPVGLSLLAGRPKVGKSWLALQIAHAIGTGGKVLDQDVAKGKVLYLALEDSPRRLKNRLQKQGAIAGVDLHLETAWPTFGNGGLTRLQSAIADNGYTLVIIDTLSRFLGRADQLDHSQMVVVLGEMQSLVMSLNVPILVVDHHRKAGAMNSDVIDDVLGSTAKTAICDVTLGLYRPHGVQSKTLEIRGRDIEDTQFALEWDATTCCWQLLGEAGEVRKGQVQKDILNTVSELGELGELATSTNIATHIGKDRSHIAKEIANLLNSGELVKDKKQGHSQPYVLP